MRTAPDRPSLSEIAQRARRAYVGSITGGASAPPWWTAVIVTASSNRQAERYEAEIERRRGAGTIPPGVLFLVVPDLDDVRIGSGGATLNAIRALAAEVLCASGAGSLEDWWRTQRVLLIHSGGDSRRLPEYSLAGKLFSALPIKTPWGDVSTVFDETLALSTDWAGKLADGLVVASGDVILTFDAGQLDWSRPGVSGVAMRQPIEIGSQHGVYVVGDEGRVYSFLQKPSAAEVRAAGGMLAEDTVALDIGLIRFDVSVAARLTELAGVSRLSEMSALALTSTEESSKLFPDCGSGVSLLTDAVLLMVVVCPELTVTTTIADTCSPSTIVSRLQVTVPVVSLQFP